MFVYTQYIRNIFSCWRSNFTVLKARAPLRRGRLLVGTEYRCGVNDITFTLVIPAALSPPNCNSFRLCVRPHGLPRQHLPRHQHQCSSTNRGSSSVLTSPLSTKSLFCAGDPVERKPPEKTRYPSNGVVPLMRTPDREVRWTKPVSTLVCLCS